MDDDVQDRSSEPPLPNSDQLAVPDLQHRIRALDLAGIDQLLAQELDHAHRPQVIQLLQSRSEQLKAGATPSGGDPSTAWSRNRTRTGAGDTDDPADVGSGGQPAVARGAHQPGTTEKYWMRRGC